MISASFYVLFLVHIILYICVNVSMYVVRYEIDHIIHSQLVNWQSVIVNPLVISGCQYSCY